MKVFHALTELAAEKHPIDLAIGVFDGVHLGHQRVLEALLDGRPVTEIESMYEPGLAEFRQRRKGFLLYD